jgi:hypothetical protein
MSDDNNPTTGVQGFADSETKLKNDGTPDHRFKEVSPPDEWPPVCRADISTEVASTETKAVDRRVSRRLAMALRASARRAPVRRASISKSPLNLTGVCLPR